MQTSKTKNWIRVLTAVLCFVILVSAASLALFKSYYTQFEKEYDVIFLGASNTYYGVEPVVVDETLGSNSVNMASALCSFESRYALLEYLLDTEPVDMVVLDVAFDALTLNMENWPFEREVPVILHFPDPEPAWSYVRTHAGSMKDLEMLYKNYAAKGMDVILQTLKGGKGEFAATKGFEAAGVEVVGGSGIQIPEKGSFYGIAANYRAENEEWLKSMIRLCQDRNVRVVVQTVPMSENMLWRYSGWDTFHEKMLSLSEECGCEYYDFNLLKCRQEILDDAYSYSDLSHLSAQGAHDYSVILADYLKRAGDGEDLSDLFYDSYEEAEEHFVYVK